MKTYILKLLILAFVSIIFVGNTYSQSTEIDSSIHPYHINYWVTGTICSVGLLTNYIGLSNSLTKDKILPNELAALDKNRINHFDSWALDLDPSQRMTYENYSGYAMTAVFLPGFLLLDKQIKKDWFDLLLMYMEINTITADLYEWSFLGPLFQNKLRPVAYYEDLTFNQRRSGNNRNSFYSGHVAFVAASTFFMVKVYSDYHPEIGNNKYFLYGTALVPPLVLGYLRVKALRHFPSDVMVGVGVGALCAILIPEFHRMKVENVSMGLFSSPESTGIAIKWQPDFLK